MTQLVRSRAKDTVQTAHCSGGRGVARKLQYEAYLCSRDVGKAVYSRRFKKLFQDIHSKRKPTAYFTIIL